MWQFHSQLVTELLAQHGYLIETCGYTEGAVALIVKRLEDADAAGDNIIACIDDVSCQPGSNTAFMPVTEYGYGLANHVLMTLALHLATRLTPSQKQWQHQLSGRTLRHIDWRIALSSDVSTLLMNAEDINRTATEDIAIVAYAFCSCENKQQMWRIEGHRCSPHYLKPNCHERLFMMRQEDKRLAVMLSKELICVNGINSTHYYP